MSSKKKVKYVETQDDLELIRLSRHKMEKFVHLPIFKKLALGCFVRIGIGQVGNSMAQISSGEGTVPMIRLGRRHNGPIRRY